MRDFRSFFFQTFMTRSNSLREAYFRKILVTSFELCGLYRSWESVPTALFSGDLSMAHGSHPVHTCIPSHKGPVRLLGFLVLLLFLFYIVACVSFLPITIFACLIFIFVHSIDLHCVCPRCVLQLCFSSPHNACC